MMAAVGAGEVIIRAQCRGRADGIGFVTDGSVHRAANLARFRQLQQGLFYAADQDHRAVEIGEFISWNDFGSPSVLLMGTSVAINAAK